VTSPAVTSGPAEPAEPAELAAARRRLARAQSTLLAALLAGAPPPDGFDPTRIRIQADALLAKRRDLVAKLRPDLADAAGADFPARFIAYARTHPRPAGGPYADAAAFARTLGSAGQPERGSTSRHRVDVEPQQPLRRSR
jgi:hypothetical protein